MPVDPSTHIMMLKPLPPRWTIAVAMVVIAGSTAAASIEDAKQIVDRAEPLRCGIFALEKRLKSVPDGSEEHASLAAEIEEAKRKLKLHYMATMDEYIAVMKTLPFEERKAVYAYTEAFAGRCGKKAE
jgi:hypothetical protein